MSRRRRDPVSTAERAAARRARISADLLRIPDDLRARARESIAEPSASVWCTSYNARLGTRPVDAWRLGHKDDVLDLLAALDDGVIV